MIMSCVAPASWRPYQSSESSADFLETAASLIGTTVTVTAQLHVSSDGVSAYTPVVGTAVTLTRDLIGAAAVGTTATGLSVYLAAGEYATMVYSVSAAGRRK